MCFKLLMEVEVFQRNPVFYIVSVIELIYGCRNLTPKKEIKESKFAVYNLNDTNYITYIKDTMTFVLY